MSQVTARVFVNLSVGKKLFCGFGLVLLLTVAVAISGGVAVRAVLQGHLKVDQLAAVNSEILQARQLERSFAIDQSAEGAKQMSDSLLRVQQLLAVLERDRDATISGALRIQDMQEAVSGYRSQFGNYVELESKARAARQDMAKAAAEARNRFEAVELEMYDSVRKQLQQSDGLAGDDPLALAETASNLSKSLFDLRNEESLFIIDDSVGALKQWSLLCEDLRSIADSMVIGLNDEQQAVIATALRALTQYQQSFGFYRQVREQSHASEKVMVERARGAGSCRGGAGRGAATHDGCQRLGPDTARRNGFRCCALRPARHRADLPFDSRAPAPERRFCPAHCRGRPEPGSAAAAP